MVARFPIRSAIPQQGVLEEGAIKVVFFGDRYNTKSKIQQQKKEVSHVGHRRIVKDRIFVNF